VPVLNNVRYASDSDHSRYESELTLWAKSRSYATQTTCNDEATAYSRALCIMGYGYFLRGSSSGLM
jgi:hypothetical protein